MGREREHARPDPLARTRRSLGHTSTRTQIQDRDLRRPCRTTVVSRPRHLLIYGPPAAGKLTVATRLADLHGLKVVDNHASVDPALRLFSFGQPQFGPLVEEIR